MKSLIQKGEIMKKQDLELLVSANAIESVVISREWLDGQAGEWEVYAYGTSPNLRGNVLETARGERRGFKNLDTAFGFVVACGYRGTVTVEDRFRPNA
jgi:hypothetical protein